MHRERQQKKAQKKKREKNAAFKAFKNGTQSAALIKM